MSTAQIVEEMRLLAAELRGYESDGIELPWLQLDELAKRLEDERVEALPAWWAEANATARTVFMADFLELYFADPTFSEAIDTLLERAR